MEIREAVQEDFEIIFPLFLQLQPDKLLNKEKIKLFYNELISSDRHFAWVAIVDGRIVGYMDVVFRTYHFAFEFVARIETTIVDENYRRKGIASRLIEKCEEKAKKSGCKVIELDSAILREGAHKFYVSCGYLKRGYLFWKHL